mmetsp:Transcript_16416/g.45301  ORF Transcript_16416/g.45301 Transcript_16416/m.45301 type:complete len:117 (+) Transcript_16416:628-978(+)
MRPPLQLLMLVQVLREVPLISSRVGNRSRWLCRYGQSILSKQKLHQIIEQEIIVLLSHKNVLSRKNPNRLLDSQLLSDTLLRGRNFRPQEENSDRPSSECARTLFTLGNQVYLDER